MPQCFRTFAFNLQQLSIETRPYAQGHPGLMHRSEFGWIGFAGDLEICCDPSCLTLKFSLKGKERNSGAVIFYSCRSVQVTCASSRRIFSAASRDSVRTSTPQTGADRRTQARQSATAVKPRAGERTDHGTTTGTGQPADCPSETATTAARSAPQSRVAVSRIRAEADLPVCQPGKPLAERANFAKVLKP